MPRSIALPFVLLGCLVWGACFPASRSEDSPLPAPQAQAVEVELHDAAASAAQRARFDLARTTASHAVQQGVARVLMQRPDCGDGSPAALDEARLAGLLDRAMAQVDPAVRPRDERLQVHVRIVHRASLGSCHTRAAIVRGPAFYHAASLVKVPLAAALLGQVAPPGAAAEAWSPLLERPARLLPRNVATADGRVALEVPPNPMSFAQWLQQSLVVSDNDAYNALLDVVGLEAGNAWLHAAGYPGMVLQNRFDQGRRPRAALGFHPAVVHLDAEGHETSWQPARASERYPFALPDVGTQVGTAHLTWRTRERVAAPWDLSFTNRVPLDEATDLVLNLLDPSADGPRGDLPIHPQARALMLDWMEQAPPPLAPYTDWQRRAAFHPVIPGLDTALGPDTYRVGGKVGWSFGFFSWMGYFAPHQSDYWVVVGVVIYANRNDVINDARYEYETLARPWVAAVAAELAAVVWPVQVTQGAAQRAVSTAWNTALRTVLHPASEGGQPAPVSD